ncbi:MAG: hypothetical protein AB1673_03950 [Actinomycetota bacterium]
MDTAALRAALVGAGVPDGIYEIAGTHEPVPPAPDFLFLRPGPDSWEIGVFERGAHTVARRFPSEDEACHAFFAMLTGSR